MKTNISQTPLIRTALRTAAAAMLIAASAGLASADGTIATPAAQQQTTQAGNAGAVATPSAATKASFTAKPNYTMGRMHQRDHPHHASRGTKD